jgi:replicative DNA helicase
MQTFNLADEFIDTNAEETLLAAIAQNPQLYWELLDYLPSGVFATRHEFWQNLAQSIENEQPVEVIPEWLPAPDPHSIAQYLADRYQRRLLAGAQERLAAALYSNKPAVELTTILEEEAARIQAAIRETQAGRLLWAGDLLNTVLSDAEERLKQRLETGHAVTGITTGLSQLDEILGGFSTGLYILAGAPGAGKTTFSLQLSLHACKEGVPVIYVTYENSPPNLVLKALCAWARIPPSSVERGFADQSSLRQAAKEIRPVLASLALIEGNSRVTVAQIRAKALQVLARHKTKRCLLVFDYLQRAAQNQGHEQLRYGVSSLAGELRELANRLDSPVLVISSQNRSSGDYGKGGGSASLDSLKESGDLEYAADVVMFLRESDKRHPVHPAVAMDLVVAKNRFGAKGLVPLIFRPDVGEMREEAHR